MNAKQVAKNLDYLQRHLRKIEPHTFEMCAYKVHADCGTHMCIAGHMSNVPQFKRRGYHLGAYDGIYWPAFRGFEGSDAVTKLLGINDRETNSLCYRWDSKNHHGAAALKKKLKHIARLHAKYQALADR